MTDTLKDLLTERNETHKRINELNNLIVKEISRLVAQGLTYRQIGDQMGVSGQRVHQLYKNHS